MLPALKSVVLLMNPANPISASTMRANEAAGERLGLSVRIGESREPSDLKAVLTLAADQGVQAVVLISDPLLYTHRSAIVALATTRRLPVIGWQSHLAESGALLSYGANTADVLRRASTYVDKILSGAKPADLPIEQPTKFELVINLRTAKTLGLTIPPTLLVRADEVIE